MFFEIIENYFNTSVLDLNSDKQEFKLCLKYLNLINSEPEIEEKIRALTNLNEIDPKNETNNLWDIICAHTFQGYQHTQNVKLYSLQTTSRFNLNDVNNFIKYSDLVNDEEMKCIYFQEAFERAIKNDRMVWLTDTPIRDVKSLIMKLGLYHLETVTPKDGFFLFEFELNNYFKPTWIDSGFIFYFNSQDARRNYGLTLDLETGLDGLKEYITRRENLTLKNISVLYPNERVKAHELSYTFWTMMKSKIEQRRDELK